MIPIFLVAFSASNLAAAQPSAPCLAGKRQSLTTGSLRDHLFAQARTPPSGWSAARAAIGFPSTTNATGFFRIQGGVMHGGQRLVIFRGDRYVGQYHLSPPPYVTV